MHALPIEKLIQQFKKLPGIGHKTAERLAFHVLSQPKEYAEEIAEALVGAKEKISFCECCQNLTDVSPCVICSDSRRDKSKICVVESPKDVAAMENMHEYRGLYHVLYGALSPMDGVGVEDIKLRELLERVYEEDTKEVIMATNPNIAGEATAMYVAKLLKPMNIKVTRIAHGIPVGGDIEYADEVTLMRAMEGRREM